MAASRAVMNFSTVVASGSHVRVCTSCSIMGDTVCSLVVAVIRAKGRRGVFSDHLPVDLL
jgi:acyl-CoA hydrolase